MKDSLNNLRKQMLKEDEDLIFDDEDHKKLLERFMLLADIDGNNIIELEELQHFPEARDILEIHFEKLNTNYLTRSSISELFPTAERLSQIISELENFFVDGERDSFLLGRTVKPVRIKFLFHYSSHVDVRDRS
jgi:hypothetical protein